MLSRIQEAELEALRRGGVGESVGSGGTDQQLMAAERELAQVGMEGCGTFRWVSLIFFTSTLILLPLY